MEKLFESLYFSRPELGLNFHCPNSWALHLEKYRSPILVLTYCLAYVNSELHDSAFVNYEE